MNIVNIICFFKDIYFRNRIKCTKTSSITLPVSSRKELRRAKLHVLGVNNQLKIGENASIKNCKIKIKGSNNQVIIEDTVSIKAGKVYLENSNGQTIHIGVGTTIESASLYVDEEASISIGSDCMIADEVIIRTGDKHSIIDMSNNSRCNTPESVVIGSHVWLGRRVSVLKGANIPDNSVVATCSVVTKGSVGSSNSIFAGIPAKVVKSNIDWCRDLL